MYQGILFKSFSLIVLLSILMAGAGCTTTTDDQLVRFELDNDTQGVMQTVDNIVNTSIVSNDPNDYKAEYEAGYIQGRLQKDLIIAMRDNSWDQAYLLDPSHDYVKQIPPSPDEIAMAERTLADGWQYTLNYIQKEGNSVVGTGLRRLVYRLIGIYHGAAKDKPENLAFDDQWMPTFSEKEMKIGYETKNITFMDIYFINAFQDMLDILPSDAPKDLSDNPTKCTAFVKRTKDDIILTHNSWIGFLNQSQAITLYINGSYLSMNIPGPGYISSGTDFGYNDKGIIFNETTHNAAHTEPRVDSLWMFWRAALAEQFAGSLDEFFEYVSLEPSGTYMNGYMVIDSKTNEIGLVEMSYKSFVFYKPDGKGGIAVTTKPEGLNTDYDKELVQPDILLGINYPASIQIREDLKSVETRPARRRQLLAQIDSVVDVETAKNLITYTDPENPLSIFGRWDLGYGETPKPKTVPDGAADAKVISVTMIKYIEDLKGILDPKTDRKAFWMKYGTPYIKGKPFIWSESRWNGQKLRSVPDKIDGSYHLLNTYIR